MLKSFIKSTQEKYNSLSTTEKRIIQVGAVAAGTIVLSKVAGAMAIKKTIAVTCTEGVKNMIVSTVPFTGVVSSITAGAATTAAVATVSTLAVEKYKSSKGLKL